MKKILLVLAVFVAVAFSCVANVEAAPQLKYGTWAFLQPGHDAKIGYSASGVVPTGIDIQTVENVRAMVDSTNSKLVIDTLFRNYFELSVRTDLFYSSFPVNDGVQEVEALVVYVLPRINFDKWNLFVELGNAYWVFSNSGGSNPRYSAFYAGFGTRYKEAVDINVGAHFIPYGDEPDITVVGLTLGRSF